MSRLRLVKTAAASIALAGLTVPAIGILGLTGLMLSVRSTLPTVAQIAAFQPAAATNVYSSDGVLLATLQIENRKPVPLKEIARQLVEATLAVEDNRFYQHKGIDLRGIGRALLANFISGDISAQGASTITQQLARNVSQFGLSKQKSLSRKLREAMTAVRIEQVFDKDTILELYLNQIYYGSGAYGVEAAARAYFGKPASKVTLAEAALLAGLPQRPIAYSPYSSPGAARTRRDVVLKRMLDTGRISIGDYERAKSEPVRLAGRHATHTLYRAPYFVDWVVQDLVSRHGVDAVYSGWKIVTTLDWQMQERAEQAVRRGLRYGATQGALVSLDPHTGEVRAMVGGVDYKHDRFNAITQGKRQPGSAFKPIVYAAAFDGGLLSLYSELKDETLEIPGGRKTWTVHNYGGGYKNQNVTVLEAITHSINTVAVETAQETGIPRIISTAHRMGITSELAPYLPLALGASAVRPLELCGAYAIFAADGNRYRPTGLKLVEDSLGRMVEQDNIEQRREAGILESSTVEQMNVALRSVVTNGTGTAAGVVPNAFGKTGTTSDNRDAWFVGYTPELATAVWVAKPMRDGHGSVRYGVMTGATGGHVAAPIWADFMRAAAPLQKQVNQSRHVHAYAINLPPPPPKVEKIIALDDDIRDGQTGITIPASEDLGDPTSAAGTESAARAGGYAQQADYQADERGHGGVRTEGTQSLGVESRAAQNRESVVVRVCASTGKLATEWCDTTLVMDASAPDAPADYCHRHHAPFGESMR